MLDVTQALAEGMRHQQAGRLADAAACYRQALAAEPRNVDVLRLLGNLAIATGDLPGAIEHFSRVLESDPSRADDHVDLGEAYRRSGDLARAIACNRRAAELRPDVAGIQGNLGQLYRLCGDVSAAVASFRTLVALSPREARGHMLLGQALLEQGETAEAEAHFRQAVQLAPHDAQAQFNLALVLQGRQRDDEAEAHYRQAIAANPRLPGASKKLGLLLLMQGRFDDAMGCLQLAAESAPSDAEVHAALGAVLQDTGRLEEATLASRRAVALDPQSATALNNLAICAQLQGQLDESLDWYRQAIRCETDRARNHSNYLYALNYHPRYSPKQIWHEHQAWGREYADPLAAASTAHTNDRAPQRRLRVGYVSAHFRQHAVSFFVEPILAAHDHGQFEIYCYSNTLPTDATTERLRGHADQWRDCTQYDDEELARFVRRDQIDILVDLSGHIGGNRLLAFARKPAPVQVTYIGYQNTTGMAAMDYRLTDDWADPPGTTDAFYTEKLVRLPRAFFCYLPSADAPPVGPLPAAQRGYVTFGSFNNPAKITPQVLDAWAQLLAQVPNSRLALLATVTAAVRARVNQALARHGVAGARIELVERLPRADYLKLIAQVDIALDPFPFNGHTTTCDTLWQGVPVVTLAGATYAQRFGSSAHVNLGMEGLIARSADEYVDVAARLAGDVQALSALRAGLRERMAASPLLDHAGFTRNLEAAYRTMWTAWCAT
ncbi:MAG: tetratricopeptide repeat protein [Pirellulales bacterium]